MTTTLTTLPALAERVNRHHRAAVEHATSAVEEAIECGRALLEAKDQLPHGQWLPWLSEHCEVKERQARNYMRVAREWPAIQAKSAPGADLTIKGALRLLAPEPEPEPWCEITPVGLKINRDPTREEWEETGRQIAKQIEADRATHAKRFAEAIDGEHYYTSARIAGSEHVEMLEITPSRRHKGYFTLAHYRQIETDNAHVDYSRRPMNQHGIEMMIASVFNMLEWTEFDAKPWGGKDPWYVTSKAPPGTPN